MVAAAAAVVAAETTVVATEAAVASRPAAVVAWLVEAGYGRTGNGDTSVER